MSRLLIVKCSSQWSLDAIPTRQRLDRVFSIARINALVSCIEKDPKLYADVWERVYAPMEDPSPPVFYAMIKAAEVAGLGARDVPVLWGRVRKMWERLSREVCLRFMIAFGRAGLVEEVGELHAWAGDVHGAGWDRGGLVRAYSYCDYKRARAAFEGCANGGRGVVHAMIDACGTGRAGEVLALRKFL
jgi:hypothetical protein